jgi:hypothetical protein
MARGPGGSSHLFHTGQDSPSCFPNKAHIQGVREAMYGMPIKDNCFTEIFLKQFPKVTAKVSGFITIQISPGDLARIVKT